MNNELLDIVEKLLDRYGKGIHWEIVEAKRTADGKYWQIVINRLPEEKEGAEDESNK